jgi:hypothetical protein
MMDEPKSLNRELIVNKADFKSYDKHKKKLKKKMKIQLV